MTRDTDVFIPLEERTAIANREGADLFLSIHANASRNPQARGIETYFLSFAMNPEAEAVAARENATSAQAMHNLPDIVKAIALNNKINESRDLADTVQKSMAKRLSAKNRSLRDLGVKQAPFVVLIGAVMPSVLAEISFVTNRQDGALLKTGAYRQQIAQALFDAISELPAGVEADERGRGEESDRAVDRRRFAVCGSLAASGSQSSAAPARRSPSVRRRASADRPPRAEQQAARARQSVTRIRPSVRADHVAMRSPADAALGPMIGSAASNIRIADQLLHRPDRMISCLRTRPPHTD